MCNLSSNKIRMESTHPSYDHTIDWSQYWDDADTDGIDDANGSADFVLAPLLEFFEKKEVPKSYADVGCGEGVTVFEVAGACPETTAVGYDAAKPVLEANRERARERKQSNVSFGRTVLPQFNPGQQFDVVTCFFTLCYVKDVETAIQNLYDAVAPGGYLVFTYHNRYAQAHFSTVAENPEQHIDESASFDPDTYAERFELVLEGESLLSYETIHDALGTWPQSVWSVTEEADRYGAWRHNPMVYVPK